MKNECRRQGVTQEPGVALREARRADEGPEDLELPDEPWGSAGRTWPGGLAGRESAGEDEQSEYVESPVAFEKLPKVVREAVLAHCPGAGSFDPVKLSFGPHVCYNVLARRGKIEMSMTVSPQGEIVEFEVDVSPTRLPKPVRATLEAEYGHIDFTRLVSVTMHFFELQYEDKAGNPCTLQLDATGRVLAELDEGGEDEG